MVRISATLIDTRDGTHMWSDHVDRDLAADMFALQDEVAGRIVATLGDRTGVLTRAIAEAAADMPYEQRSLLELVASYCVYTEHFRADEHARLRDAFEQAVKREPRAAEAWAVVSSLYAAELTQKVNPRPNALERHRDAAQRAVELNPRSQQAWIAMASYHHLARDLTALRHAVDRVVALNPLNTDLVAAEYTVLVTARRSHLLRRVLYTAALYPSLGGDVRVELDGVHGAHIAPDGETFAVIKETTAPGRPTSIAATRSALSSWRLRRLS